MSNNSKISLCCISCNESIDIISENLESEAYYFALKHPNCTLEAFSNGRSVGIVKKSNKQIENKWLN